jgi:Uncharacterized protein involved in cysteine biosynthesis
MLFQAALAAWRQIISPAFRRILWLSIGLTVGLLMLVWAGLTRLFGYFLATHPLSSPYPVLDGYLVLVSGIGLFFVLLYLLPAITAVVAGYFIDDAADIVEKRDFPNDSPGQAAPFMRSLLYGLRFAGLSLLVNLVALALFFLPGINLIVFFLANAYLLGREYFELAAGRFLSPADAARMRTENRMTVLSAGAVMAGLLMIPVINLLTPLFGIALMVHVYKRLGAKAA